jgi:hypothetical protein
VSILCIENCCLMLSLPKDIFFLIDPENISIFLTCKNLYQFVNVFYRKFRIDCFKNRSVLKLDSSSTRKFPKYCENIFILLNAPIVPDSKFRNIRHISFRHSFNRSVDALNYLPNVESIVFGELFDQPVNTLSKRLKSLTFGESFNHSVDNLPETLTSLTFGECFNQPVDNLPVGFLIYQQH